MNIFIIKVFSIRILLEYFFDYFETLTAHVKL